MRVHRSADRENLTIVVDLSEPPPGGLFRAYTGCQVWHASCNDATTLHEVCGLVEIAMTQSATSAAESKSPLDAAQKIVAELQGMTSENQSLALQFAMQTLRLTPPIAHPAPAAGSAHAHIPHAQIATSASGQPTDIKAFTAVKAPQSDQQFTAVVAYYYQFEAPLAQRRDSIDATIMKDAARLAGREQVKDWNMTLNNAMRAGYLDRAERGAFKLSAVGENLVAITLPGAVRGGAGNGGTKSKKASKKKATTKKAGKKGD